MNSSNNAQFKLCSENHHKNESGNKNQSSFVWKNEMICLYTQLRCKNTLHQLIPEVPVNQMHLLSNKSDNNVVLACLSGVIHF